MPKTETEQLESLRLAIDSINENILRLLNERATFATDVAKIKRMMYEAEKNQRIAEGKTNNNVVDEVHFYRPEREAQILQKLTALNKGPLSNDSVRIIFREIISACLSLERQHIIAYLGPAGTFTEEAARKNFGSNVQRAPQGSIHEVFSEVENGKADYGVVPVENSTEGVVTHTLDSFLNSSLRICGEVVLPIKHHLMIKKGHDRKSIQWVSSHQQSLGQCRRWLDMHLGGIERKAVGSNGEAARLAAELVGMAAIAGETAADYYQLEIIERNIQDLADNTTRFLVLGKQQVPPCGHDKTAIIVAVRNESGALFRLLAFFKRAKVNLTRLDTRPSRTEKWAFYFFMEFEGHEQQRHIGRLLSQLVKNSVMLKRLGSYPATIDSE